LLTTLTCNVQATLFACMVAPVNDKVELPATGAKIAPHVLDAPGVDATVNPAGSVFCMETEVRLAGLGVGILSVMVNTDDTPALTGLVAIARPTVGAVKALREAVATDWFENPSNEVAALTGN
jgi:hypothetical protein